MTDNCRQATRPRRAAILIVVLAVMATLSALAATMLRGVHLSRRQFRNELHQRQVEQLLDAAVATAHQRVLAGGPFQERRTIPADEIVGQKAAGLSIDAHVAPNGGLQVEALVEYPLGNSQPIRGRKSQWFPPRKPLLSASPNTITPSPNEESK